MKKRKQSEIRARALEAEPETNIMEVMAIPLNNRLVIARDSERNAHTVYVGNSETFVYGDVIEVKPHGAQAGIWELVSPIPRDKRRPLLPH